MVVGIPGVSGESKDLARGAIMIVVNRSRSIEKKHGSSKLLYREGTQFGTQVIPVYKLIFF